MKKFNKKAVFAALMGALSSVSSFATESQGMRLNNADKEVVTDFFEIRWANKPELPTWEENESKPKVTWERTPEYYAYFKKLLPEVLEDLLKDPNYKMILQLNKKLFGKIIIWQPPWVWGKKETDEQFRMSLTGYTTTPAGIPTKGNKEDVDLKNHTTIRPGWRDFYVAYQNCDRSQNGIPHKKLLDSTITSAGRWALAEACEQCNGNKENFKRIYLRRLTDVSLRHELAHVCDFALRKLDNQTEIFQTSHMKSLPKLITSTKYGCGKAKGWIRRKDNNYWVMPDRAIDSAIKSLSSRHKADVSVSEIFAEALTIGLCPDQHIITPYLTKDKPILEHLQTWAKRVMDSVRAGLSS